MEILALQGKIAEWKINFTSLTDSWKWQKKGIKNLKTFIKINREKKKKKKIKKLLAFQRPMEQHKAH